MFKWGKQTVVFKVGPCLSGGFLSACHLESLVFSPCPFPFPHPPVPLLHWSALSVGCLPREVCTAPHHRNQLWLQTVVKLCTIHLVKLKIIFGIIIIIIPFGIFCTSFSGNSPLARPISGFKYLHEIFNQVVLCNEHIATLVLCLMFVGDQLS